MKKLLVGLMAGLLMLGLAGMAQATTLNMPFTHLYEGAVSYDDNGGNVVTTGSVFYDTLEAANLLTLTGMTGNLAMWGVVEFDPNNPDFLWVAANGNQELDINVRLRDVQFDVDLDGIFTDTANGGNDFIAPWRIVGIQDGTNYLTSFNELGAPGYTELTTGVWMDVALGPDYAAYGGNNNGLLANQMAISIIMDGVILDPTEYSSFQALLLDGPLGAGTPGHTAPSGINASTVPEPATMMLFGIGLLGLAGVSRKKRQK